MDTTHLFIFAAVIAGTLILFQLLRNPQFRKKVVAALIAIVGLLAMIALIIGDIALGYLKWLWWLPPGTFWLYVALSVVGFLGFLLLMLRVLDVNGRSTRVLSKLPEVVYSHPLAKFRKVKTHLLDLSEEEQRWFKVKTPEHKKVFLRNDKTVSHSASHANGLYSTKVPFVPARSVNSAVIFCDRDMYAVKDNRQAQRLLRLDASAISRVDEATAIGANHIVLKASYKHENSGRVVESLWLVSQSHLSCEHITKDFYSTAFTVHKFGRILFLVVYEGTLSWSINYGCNPKISHVYLIEESTSAAIKVISVSKRLGEIIGVDYKPESTVLTLACDANKQLAGNCEPFQPIRNIEVNIEALLSG